MNKLEIVRDNQLFRFMFVLGLAFSINVLLTEAKAQPTRYREAPQLAELVAAGQLPPVEERLPKSPVLVEPVERIGQYGGIWRMGLIGGQDTFTLMSSIGYENLVSWNPEWTGVIPNVAEAVEVNAEGNEYIFRLREDMKWSDGHPFTADDIMFWYENVFMNSELTPVKPTWLLSGDEPVVVEKIDDYTVAFKFNAPKGLFLQNLSVPAGSAITNFPRHYLEQFHMAYNSEGIASLVREAGFDGWVALFGNKSDPWASREKPTLHAWMLTTAYGEGTRVVAERNPFYWKVDPEGNQLPYIDRVIFDQFEDPEVLLLRALAGEIDMQERHITALQNKPIFLDTMERGNYHLIEKTPAVTNSMVIQLNLNHKDPIKREIFQNREFRIGLSHAIDRQELIDLAWLGQGEPYQAAPMRMEVDIYSERMAKQHTEYDVAQANEYLDRAGYSARDADGFRLGPDGNRISFVIELIIPGTSAGGTWPDALELIQGYWQTVGIDTQSRTIDRSLFLARVQANEHDAVVWSGGQRAILDSSYYLPNNPNSSFFAMLWTYWYLGDPRGEEPPAVVQEQMELWDQIQITPELDQQTELLRQLIDIATDQFYVMGMSSIPSGYIVVKNNFHNVSEPAITSGTYVWPAAINPSQFFIGQ